MDWHGGQPTETAPFRVWFHSKMADLSDETIAYGSGHLFWFQVKAVLDQLETNPKLLWDKPKCLTWLEKFSGKQAKRYLHPEFGSWKIRMDGGCWITYDLFSANQNYQSDGKNRNFYMGTSSDFHGQGLDNKRLCTFEELTKTLIEKYLPNEKNCPAQIETQTSNMEIGEG